MLLKHRQEGFNGEVNLVCAWPFHSTHRLDERFSRNRKHALNCKG